MKILTINAPAKINLGLQVLNKRADGFHSINSLMTRVPVFDKINLESADKLVFECDTDLGIPNEKNIAYLAAKQLMNKLNISEGIKITLKKVIPAGGGLGGGSSDAAAVMKGICSYFKIPDSDELSKILYDIACSLGSDVPFFLQNGSAIATGRGEILQYFDYTLPWTVQIVAPNFGINTGIAYQNLNRDGEEYYTIDYSKYFKFLNSHPVLLKQIFRNDFVYPEMENASEFQFIIGKMYEAGALFASMSGSGSCCFGLYENPKNIEHTDKYFGNYKTFVGKL